MKYFVIDSNTGAKYGPADIALLNQWIAEGRLLPQSILEDEVTGVQSQAKMVQGLNFPVTTVPQEPVMKPSEPTASGSVYGQQPNMGAPGPGPQQPYAQYPRQDYNYAGVGGEGDKILTSVWIFSALSVLCCPIIFGLIAISKASKLKQMGHPQAQTAMTVAIIALALGVLFGVVANIATRTTR